MRRAKNKLGALGQEMVSSDPSDGCARRGCVLRAGCADPLHGSAHPAAYDLYGRSASATGCSTAEGSDRGRPLRPRRGLAQARPASKEKECKVCVRGIENDTSNVLAT